VGGRSNSALDRAGRLGDGWLAAWCSPRRFAEGTALVEQVGIDRDVDWHHGLQIWAGVGDYAFEGRTQVAAGMQRFYGMPFEKHTPVGTVDDIVAFLGLFVEAGAKTLSLKACGPDPETELEVIAQVAERLRR
jgi:alkanesulfonate monooxygenase SsuD/methylene tetrahydromethanopterin reductase-like flavin-dependent oxidoreductase (luciferase family)